MCERLEVGLKEDAYAWQDTLVIKSLLTQLRHFRSLGLRVVDQAQRRVINGEKIFSIFEPHTELLKRGKAGKAIEFGHMIVIQQVENKFITDYEAFERKPVGENPAEFSADKGFYESMEKSENSRKLLK